MGFRIGLLALLVGCGAPVLKVKPINGAALAYYTAEGGVVIENEENICVAPPAQAARVISGSGSGTVKGGRGDATVDVGGDGELVHEVEKLFELRTSMLYMEHGLYRLCEAQVNGFIPKEAYPEMFSEILAASEMLAEQEAKIEESRTESSKADASRAEAEAMAEEARTEQIRLKANPALGGQ